MIKFLSSFAKGVGLSIVIVSILEMLLPNNKTKKYIRIVMGIFVLFNIMSPFINNKNIFNLDNINLEEYYTNETSSEIEVDQSSMDKRIEDLYVQELERDIENKMKEKGYKVESCKVDVKIGNENEESKILKIRLKIDKDENADANTNTKKQDEEESLENKIVTEVQKIKTIDISVDKSKKNQADNESKIDKSDIQNIKKFLIDEYGVNEECLEIN